MISFLYIFTWFVSIIFTLFYTAINFILVIFQWHLYKIFTVPSTFYKLVDYYS